MIISKSIARQYAYNAGFRGTALDNAVDIAVCESGLNTGASCLNCFGVPEDSRGLWQINVNAHPQYKTVDLYDPKINAQAAYAVYKEAGYSFKPWYNCAVKLALLDPSKKKSSDPIIDNNYGFAFIGLIALYFISKD